jgi:UDP-glucose 4-epimerase
MLTLVTGGDGFIGKNLVDLLKWDSGHAVRVYDKSSLQAFPGYSVLNPTSLRNAMTGCDVVYHLAGIVGVERTLRVPVKTFATNALGTLLVAQEAKRQGAKMFLASSSEVYGKGYVGYLDEDAPCRCDTDKRWVYAMSKIAAEMMVQAVLPPEQYVIGRFFNVVGPGQRPESGMVLPRFIDAAIRGKYISVYGTGMQHRTFGFVEEIIKAVVELTENHSGTFNIAGSASCSIMELAEKVKDILASDSEIVFRAGPTDALRRLADTTKLKSALGWIPNMPIEKIIKLTAEWWLRELEE